MVVGGRNVPRAQAEEDGETERQGQREEQERAASPPRSDGWTRVRQPPRLAVGGTRGHMLRDHRPGLRSGA